MSELCQNRHCQNRHLCDRRLLARLSDEFPTLCAARKEAMNADFLDAHDRHWQDAETLLDANRLANADHLYGIAAECGLKRLMVCFGMKVRADGAPLLQGDWVHADKAWDQYESYRSGYLAGAAYALCSSNPFANWSAGQRYAKQAQFDAGRVQAHRQAASSVRQHVNAAQRAGLI